MDGNGEICAQWLAGYRVFRTYIYIEHIPCFVYKHSSSNWNIFLTWCRVNSLRPSDAYMRRKTNHHWFRLWLVAWTAPSHYMNQCWNIVNWTLRNKLLWYFNRNSNIFIQENALENVVCEMAYSLSRPECVKRDTKTAYTVIFTRVMLGEAGTVAMGRMNVT